MKRLIPATLLACGVLAGPVWASQTAIVDPGTRSCLQMDHGDVGSPSVVEVACDGRPSQQFVLTEQPDGYALIAAAGSQQCLGASAVLVSQACDATNTGQMFKPVPQQGGGFALLNRRSGLCVGREGDHPALADCESRSAIGYQMPGWPPARPAGRLAGLAGAARSQAHTPSTGLVISGLHIEGDYTLYGSKFDGALLTNSTITGALKIDGVRNLYVQGNHLNAIWFRGQQPTDTVTIDGNDITGADNDCVQIHDGPAHPTHVLIENNDIHDCGSKYPASGLYHAIYDQVPDVVIRQNHIWNAKSAISIRSSALVDGNVIERVTNGGAIEYFSDHAAPEHSSLVLKNNVIVSTLTNAPSALGTNRGLIVLGNGIGANKRAVATVVLQHNTVKVLNTAQDSTGTYFVVYTQAASPAVQLSGNTFTNLIPKGACIGPRPVDSASNIACSH
jgi:hypothetical protein